MNKQGFMNPGSTLLALLCNPPLAEGIPLREPELALDTRTNCFGLVSEARIANHPEGSLGGHGSKSRTSEHPNPR